METLADENCPGRTIIIPGVKPTEESHFGDLRETLSLQTTGGGSLKEVAVCGSLWDVGGRALGIVKNLGGALR